MTWSPSPSPALIEAPAPWPQELVAPLLEWAAELTLTPPRPTLTAANRPTYRHPNGFVKIHLGYDEVTDEHLTLHIWHGVEDPCIHNHRWGFASRILRGRLENTIYDFTPCTDDIPAAVRPYEYTPTKLGLEYSVQTMESHIGGLLLPRVVSADVLSAGDTYRQASALFHAASSSEDAITLMTRSLRRHDTAIIMRAPSCPRIVNEPVELEEMDPRQKRILCRQVARQL